VAAVEQSVLLGQKALADRAESLEIQVRTVYEVCPDYRALLAQPSIKSSKPFLLSFARSFRRGWHQPSVDFW
jgi:hypothetical protein